MSGPATNQRQRPAAKHYGGGGSRGRKGGRGLGVLSVLHGRAAQITVSSRKKEDIEGGEGEEWEALVVAGLVVKECCVCVPEGSVRGLMSMPHLLLPSLFHGLPLILHALSFSCIGERPF